LMCLTISSAWPATAAFRPRFSTFAIIKTSHSTSWCIWPWLARCLGLTSVTPSLALFWPNIVHQPKHLWDRISSSISRPESNLIQWSTFLVNWIALGAVEFGVSFFSWIFREFHWLSLWLTWCIACLCFYMCNDAYMIVWISIKICQTWVGGWENAKMRGNAV
jgi:hypothetical protein